MCNVHICISFVLKENILRMCKCEYSFNGRKCVERGISDIYASVFHDFDGIVSDEKKI